MTTTDIYFNFCTKCSHKQEWEGLATNRIAPQICYLLVESPASDEIGKLYYATQERIDNPTFKQCRGFNPPIACPYKLEIILIDDKSQIDRTEFVK